jgi:hypothetical protein
MEKSMFTARHKQCDICAYHEAGHILFAYLCGYTCKEAQLVDESNDAGFSSYSIIDYGADAVYAGRFIGTEDLSFFTSLQEEEQQHALAVGRKVARIYMGGSTAATVFQKGGPADLSIPFQMDFTDLERIEFVAMVFRALGADEPNLLEHYMNDARYTLGNINLWHTVKDLAERLLRFNPITRGDIEECLEEHGIQYAAESDMHENLQWQSSGSPANI